MKLYPHSEKIIIKVSFIIPVLLILLAASCFGRKNKLDGSNMIPKKDLVLILRDIYISDGLLSHPRVRHMYPSLDSLSTYYHVIEKHGYSMEAMDKTMKYYFIKKPKDLIKIYDQILGLISDIDTRAEKATLIEQARMENLWPGKDLYYFPDPYGTDSTSFDIKLDKVGSYTFTFTTTVFPDDQSVNPVLSVYTYISDLPGTVQKKYIGSLNYIKDGIPHQYVLKIQNPGAVNMRLAGCLYTFENNPGELGIHMLIESISISFIYTLA